MAAQRRFDVAQETERPHGTRTTQWRLVLLPQAPGRAQRQERVCRERHTRRARCNARRRGPGRSPGTGRGVKAEWDAKRAALDAEEARIAEYLHAIDYTVSQALEAAGYHRPSRRLQWRKRHGPRPVTREERS